MSEIPTVYQHVFAGGDRRGTARLVMPRIERVELPAGGPDNRRQGRDRWDGDRADVHAETPAREL